MDYVFIIVGCATSWKASLQTTIALSTTEVEHMAIPKVGKEPVWLRGLYFEICGITSYIS